MSKQTPASPDYTGAANAQAASSRDVTEQQTWANRPTINTPFGQQTWESKPTWDPTTGTYLNAWTQNTNLTPESQKALDDQMSINQGKSDIAQSLLGRAQGEFGQEMNWDDFTKLAGTPGTPNYNPENIQKSIGDTPDYIKSAGDAIYGQWSNRQEPRMQQEADQTRTKLYNAGLKEGDQAYDQEMQRLSQDQNDARTQAQYQATIGSGQEAQRQQGMDVTQGGFANSAAQQALQQQLGIGSQSFNQNMAGANYQNQARQQQIAESMQQRGFSLNEINSILTGAQVGMPGMPSFNTANASQAAQYNSAAQNQGQYNLDAFSAQQAGLNSAMSGLAGGAMMFSDRRLKKDIELVGYEPVKAGKDGFSHFLPKYRWTYVWGEKAEGFMADDVERARPDAVTTHESGYKMVDYGRL